MADPAPIDSGSALTLFLCGDVMTGRGIDQILPHSSDPRLHEPAMQDARGYVKLAERESGPIPREVKHDYIWGDALAELHRMAPGARIINLETSVTTSDDWAPKGINYRMHPQNVPCLTAASIDCCVLANNHLLDWGEAGLVQTLQVLHEAGLKTAGAGENLRQASAPAVLQVGPARVLVFAYGSPSSGIPPHWAARCGEPGIQFLPDVSDESADAVATRIEQARQPGDMVVLSVHWGGNWGYDVPEAQQRFAHRVIDRAGVDVVHGHSSHHPKGVEVHHERLILYGCGDFLNDYEGIGGHEAYRSELTLMYFPQLEPGSGKLVGLHMTPMRIHKLQLKRPSANDVQWVQQRMHRESQRFGAEVVAAGEGRLALRW